MLITYKKLSLNQKSTYFYILCYFPIQFCVSLCIDCTGKRSGISVKGLRKFLSSEEHCCLCSNARLPQDSRVKFARQSETSYSTHSAAIVRFSAVVVRFAAFLRQPCKKAYGDLAVVRQMHGWRTLTSVVRTPCMPCSSLACLAAALRPLEIAKKMNMSKI